MSCGPIEDITLRLAGVTPADFERIVFFNGEPYRLSRSEFDRCCTCVPGGDCMKHGTRCGLPLSTYNRLRDAIIPISRH